MVCKNCKGNLVYKDGLYICESCKSKHTVSDYYEDTKLFICYVENDDLGRRTKASQLAEKIYNEASRKKINAFYERISASGLYGDELERVCNAALIKAEAVVIVGSSKKEFEALAGRYSDYYAGKKLFPAFVNMDAYALPKQLVSYQAVDLNKVAAEIDLVNSLCDALGIIREPGKNPVDEAKQRKYLIAGIITVIFLIAVTSFIGYEYVFKKTDDYSQLSYDKAISYVESEDYSKAIDLFSELIDYRDTVNQMQLIYEKFGGYYEDDNSGISMHLKVLDNGIADVTVSGSLDGKKLNISEREVFDGNVLSVKFSSSENNIGQLSLQIEKSDIILKVDSGSDSSSGEKSEPLHIVFSINDKSDKGFSEALTGDEVLGIIKEKTTKTMLEEMGIELVNPEFVSKSNSATRYTFKNTDIKGILFKYDVSKMNTSEDVNVEDPLMLCISAPAKLIIPDKIGESNEAFVEDDIIFVPDGSLDGDGRVTMGSPKEGIIEEDTPVCVTSRKIIGDKNFDLLLETHIKSDD